MEIFYIFFFFSFVRQQTRLITSTGDCKLIAYKYINKAGKNVEQRAKQSVETRNKLVIQK